MALQTSGAISLNDIHVEAGGTTGTQASINDADIRGLISKGSGVQMSFNEWYGASNIVQYSAPIVTGSQQFIKAVYTGFFMNPSPTILLNPMGTLNGSTGQWSFGGLGIKGITTQINSGTTSPWYLQIHGTLTASNWTSITYQTSLGTATLPASAFTYSTGSAMSSTAHNYTNGASHIINGTVTITI